MRPPRTHLIGQANAEDHGPGAVNHDFAGQGLRGTGLRPGIDGVEILDEALTAKLNELGAAGWEAIGLTGMTLGTGRTKDLIVILKRPRG